MLPYVALLPLCPAPVRYRRSPRATVSRILLPVYTWWQLPYYYAGCKLYDILAGTEGGNIGAYMMGELFHLVFSSPCVADSSPPFTGKKKTLDAFPMLKEKGLAGGVVYYDGELLRAPLVIEARS